MRLYCTNTCIICRERDQIKESAENIYCFIYIFLHLVFNYIFIIIFIHYLDLFLANQSQLIF